jgi:dienelactone hydrolase
VSQSMKKYLFATIMVFILSLILSIAYSQVIPGQIPAGNSAVSPNLTIPIWAGIAPGSENRPQDDDPNAQPTITAYLPDESKSNGTALIVCPGGAFRALSNEESFALWLNQQGIAAFVLKYHIMDSRSGRGGMMGGMGQIPRNLEIKNANANPEPNNKELARIVRLATADGRQAIRIVRQNAEKWKIDPKRVGIAGFSAGGGVAVGSVLGSKPENRPDFVATLYGPALVDVNVPTDAPPLFIAVAADHMPVSAGCVALYDVWKAAGKSAELHIYSDGRAGFSMREQGLTSDSWNEQLYDWMKVKGFINPK